jgi:hypothetical protein
MVDPRVDRPRAGIDLADVVRRFGPAYRAHYGQGMMPSQNKALATEALRRNSVSSLISFSWPRPSAGLGGRFPASRR